MRTRGHESGTASLPRGRLLLMFMVAGIYFLRDLLLSVFTGLLLRVRSSSALSLLICVVAAVLSAFLDALTVVAVIVTVGLGFYDVYHRAASGKRHEDEHDPSRDESVPELHAGSLEQLLKALPQLRHQPLPDQHFRSAHRIHDAGNDVAVVWIDRRPDRRVMQSGFLNGRRVVGGHGQRHVMLTRCERTA